MAKERTHLKAFVLLNLALTPLCSSLERDDVRQPVCHLLELLLQTNMRVASHDFAHYVHHKLVLPTKGLYSHHHAKCDIVQNITHDPSIFGHFNFPTKKNSKSYNTFKNVKWHIQLA